MTLGDGPKMLPIGVKPSAENLRNQICMFEINFDLC